MKVDVFKSLRPAQQHTLVVAMLVRNAMEDFHAANLSDAQMKELNQLIRYGVYNAVTLIETMNDDPTKADSLAWLMASIPDYWEVPGRDPDPLGHGNGSL